MTCDSCMTTGGRYRERNGVALCEPCADLAGWSDDTPIPTKPGRKPFDNKRRLQMVLPGDLLDRLKASVRHGQVSKFVRQAIEDALADLPEKR